MILYQRKIMEKEMTILEQLKAKIAEIKVNYEKLTQKNSELQNQVNTLLNTQKAKDEAIDMLKYELQDKDKELKALLDDVNNLIPKNEKKV